MMPISFGSLPFNILFFVCGVVAKRNRWLEDGLVTISPTAKLLSKAIVVVFSIGVFTAASLIHASPRGFGYLKKNVCGEGVEIDTGLKDEPLLEIGAFILGLSTLAGVYCMAVNVAMFDIFRLHFNYTSNVTKFYSESAYAAYVIHPFVLTALTYAWAVILQVSGPGAAITFDSGPSSTSCIDGDGYLWLGSLFTCFFTLALTFPLGYVLRKIPGVDQVL